MSTCALTNLVLLLRLCCFKLDFRNVLAVVACKSRAVFNRSNFILPLLANAKCQKTQRLLYHVSHQPGRPWCVEVCLAYGSDGASQLLPLEPTSLFVFFVALAVLVSERLTAPLWTLVTFLLFLLLWFFLLLRVKGKESQNASSVTGRTMFGIQ